MVKRRQFLSTGAKIIPGLILFLNPVFGGFTTILARVKKTVLPRETNLSSLVGKNPENYDITNLDPTPLKRFATMGRTEYEVDLANWHLTIKGQVSRSIVLTYEEMLAMPSVEKKLLLTCPGFFSQVGIWKGIDMKELLLKAGIKGEGGAITFSCPFDGQIKNRKSFPREQVLANRVFLAYGINGDTLPKKHGFPLRVVAEGAYGGNWIKYVDTVEV